MASIFTYQDELPRLHSPWSTPGNSTPQFAHVQLSSSTSKCHGPNGLTRLEPERPDGPTEYKLHLLLRQRRKFLSTSTASHGSGLYHLASSQSSPSIRSMSDPNLDKASLYPSTHARQNRLQQLTTQLLWRLQQSSPFHSSSNADLVLPVLPEATPKLGVPDRPAKLLPGLEESQGALYEIGVADDGSFLGLVEDELQESLTNLRAMAASLGCVTNTLRKVAVGTCEWLEVDNETESTATHHDQLWVAEVLVFPDSRGSTEGSLEVPPMNLVNARAEEKPQLAEIASGEQLRVTLVGATTAGKSSLLGTLTTSTLDNGRGKSRLSLLKHRHEIASGVTSSVAQELIGYSKTREGQAPIVNYAFGDVSSWIDIHNLAERRIFLSDSPGLPRFAKSTLRTLISWKPNWTLLCVASDESEEPPGDSQSHNRVDLSLIHLNLCLRLRLPLVVVITKLDIATKSGLRLVLAKLLSALKNAGRKPVILSNKSAAPAAAENPSTAMQVISETDQAEIDDLVSSMLGDRGDDIVPIVMTSAVTGAGISKIHSLLRTLPTSRGPGGPPYASMFPHPGTIFYIDEVFSIPPSRVYAEASANHVSNRGVVLCGQLGHGSLSIGDVLCLGPFTSESSLLDDKLQAIERPHSFSTGPPNASRNMNSMAKSYSGDGFKMLSRASGTVYLSVRVVSLRNLRLPVGRMRQGETGTIGIELVSHEDGLPKLSKARKGMVLTDTGAELVGCRTFSATFPATEFSMTNSPPLILGGHATVYANSVRASAKVMAVAMNDDDRDQADGRTSTSSHTEVFSFDSDDDTTESKNRQGDSANGRKIRITFRFGKGVEWLQIHDKVLVVPTETASGPVSNAVAQTASGLVGFVGSICDIAS